MFTRFDALCVHVFDGSARFACFQISYASSVSLEVSRAGLPFYYQLLPTEDNYIPAVASIISYYGWMQFTIISEDEHVFLDVSEGMILLYLASLDKGGNPRISKSNPEYVCMMYMYL